MFDRTNYTMLFDFYELTMANGYYVSGKKNEIAYFDVFFRDIPDGGGFAIAAGLDEVIEYIKNLKFTEEDIAYLRSKKIFDENFLEYLKTFRFTGDIYAIPEGTPIFPREPIMTVRAPAIEAQFIETFVLLALNHQSLIATKANRIVRAADGGIRRTPRTGCGRCSLWSARRVYRWLCFHLLHDERPRFSGYGLRHHGTFMGADVRQRI